MLSDNAPSVPVEIFCSPKLAAFWTELDAFEGPDYRRVVVVASVGKRRYRVNIYELAAKPA